VEEQGRRGSRAVLAPRWGWKRRGGGGAGKGEEGAARPGAPGSVRLAVRWSSMGGVSGTEPETSEEQHLLLGVL
jgi:hypothetical protein